MKTSSKKKTELLTSDELRILTALQKNSKDSISSIAKSCGFSRQRVQRILAQLEEDRVIWGYTAITDEKKEGRLRYIILIKRSMNRVDRETSKKIAYIYFDEEYEKQGIIVEGSYYLHGEYDWMIILTAKTLRDAKKFSTVILEKYPNIIAKVILIQVLHSSKSHHIKNPNPDTLLDFL
ncbi:MAG TPA: Lrp/AsnC family transcriptional regulator [Thermoplasmata archaeon]|nr:Lrp/AsnC family transcriptional regulator [Thermoplasmata archaeon]